MESLLKIAALLALVAGTSASGSPCSFQSNTYLNCSGRGLSVPPSGYWPQITYLDLRNNAITELPKNSLIGFPALIFLHLRNNSLTKLNFEEIVNNKNLKYLNIENNEIETLTAPSRGTTLQNQLDIFASNNRISVMNQDFFSFAPNLLTLNIKNNHLIVEPGHPVLNHLMLEQLHMSFGGIGLNAVNSSLLAGLPNLKFVDLSHASISSVDGAFVKNKHLEYIHLEGNAINNITPGTFPTERRIRILDLRRNPLFKLDIAAVNNTMAAYGSIIISQTPLACECGFEVLFRWTQTNNINIKASCSANHRCLFPTESPLSQPP